MQTTTDKKASAAASLSLMIFSIPAHTYRCWVAQHLWVWFATPVFGIEAPKVAVLYGLTWLIGLLWPFPTVDKEPITGVTVTLKIFTILAISSIGLLIGYIANAIAT